MSSSLKNIILILAFVILLPVSIFIAMEAGSLNENEQILEEAYREQLDAIIFSVNQYSGDVFDFYLKQIDYTWKQSGETTPIDSTFLQQNLAIDAVIVKQEGRVGSFPLNPDCRVPDSFADSLFDNSSQLIERLVRYKETGYIKPELMGQFEMDSSSKNVTMVILGSATPCLIVLNPELYIEDLLAPKIQQISGKHLVISVAFAPTGEVVYGSQIPESQIAQSGELTLLENYTVSVTLYDQDINALLSKRTRQNMLMLIITSLLVLVGVIFVLRNIRNEVRLSRTKSDFVANVSHEIRTPLALISMFIETLKMGRVGSEEKKKEYYHIIHKEASRLNNIVNKILTFSQIDALKKTYKFEAIDLNQLIHETIESYSYHLADKGFEYHLSLSEKAPISADRESLIEVLVNLIDNAIKYSSETKELSIKTTSNDGATYLEVADKGIGISSKDQAQIFKKFYRVSTGDVHNIKGTGLGLALVFEIMKAHGGDISLRSEVGKGSTFILKFPTHHE